MELISSLHSCMMRAGERLIILQKEKNGRRKSAPPPAKSAKPKKTGISRPSMLISGTFFDMNYGKAVYILFTHCPSIFFAYYSFSIFSPENTSLPTQPLSHPFTGKANIFHQKFNAKIKKQKIRTSISKYQSSSSAGYGARGTIWERQKCEINLEA